jgi:predicted Ser/Thr protein kinase
LEIDFMNAAKTIGRYEIIEELGRGAMGSVFKARDPAVGRTVAVKTILTLALAGAQSEQYRTRFLREAHAAGSLAHPGIVPVFDVGEHEGVPFLVMEFVDGRTLADALKKGERFTLDQVCEIGIQIAEALAYAHRQGVVHRDIKPANILMTAREVYGAERPRITDFGIAKLTTNEITTTGQLLGTPSFMPPEQFTGLPIDGRADLFSLGVILYSLSTGEQPFPGETMTAVSYKVVHTEPVPPSKLNPGIPPLLEEVILKCLAKSPAQRYQTGEELARDLAAVRANAGATVLRSTPPPQAALLDSDITPALPARSIPPQHGAPAANGAPAPAAAGADPQPAKGGVAKGAVAKKRAAKPSGKQGFKRLRVITVAGMALVAVALIVEAWLGTRHRLQTPPAPAQTPAPATTAAPQPPKLAPQQNAVEPPTAAPPAAAAPPEHSVTHKRTHAKTSPSVAAKSAKPSPAIVAAPQVAAAQPAATTSTVQPQAPKPAPPAFDPRNLDPKSSARLRVDLKHVPDGLAFTIEMNSKPYLHAVAGDKGSLENLFVPPGVQEFSVVYQGSGQQKSSNIVSDEFKARKRHTLHIELMGHARSPAIVKGMLNGDAQLFVSLK